jgi:hypothetical protein
MVALTGLKISTKKYSYPSTTSSWKMLSSMLASVAPGGIVSVPCAAE